MESKRGGGTCRAGGDKESGKRGGKGEKRKTGEGKEREREKR